MHRLSTRLIVLPVLASALFVVAGYGATSKAATSTAAVVGSTPSLAAGCAQISGLESAFAKALAGTAPTNLAARIKLLGEYTAKTPASVRPDFKVVVSELAKIAAALKGVNLTTGSGLNPAAIAKISELAPQLKDPQFTKALAAIEAWAEGGCKG